MSSVKVVDENTILVNLSATPISPSQEYPHILIQNGEGWVEIQQRTDGLYVDNQKVVPRFSKIVGGIEPHGLYPQYLTGYELRDETTGKESLNANAVDALLDHSNLIPREWNEMTIWFPETTWTNSGRGDCVALRGIRREGDKWESCYKWFGPGWASIKVEPTSSPEQKDQLMREFLNEEVQLPD